MHVIKRLGYQPVSRMRNKSGVFKVFQSQVKRQLPWICDDNPVFEDFHLNVVGLAIVPVANGVCQGLAQRLCRILPVAIMLRLPGNYDGAVNVPLSEVICFLCRSSNVRLSNVGIFFMISSVLAIARAPAPHSSAPPAKCPCRQPSFVLCTSEGKRGFCALIRISCDNLPVAEALAAETLYSVVFLQNIHITDKRPSRYTQPFRQLIHRHGWLLFNNPNDP